MTQGRPRQFFDEVADRNARLAIGSPGDLCHAINAIMTLDALFGILHAALYDANIVTEPRDDKWKDDLANLSAEYRLLRDTAFALKHGKLDGKKPRIVRHPNHTMPSGFDPAAFAPAAFDTEKVWIEIEGIDHPAYEVIEKVAELARSELNRHGM